jgi:hypothetical protein
MDWLDLLPPDLAELGYRAGEEIAWSRGDALTVVEFLKTKGYVVLGVDIWLPTQPGPTIPAPFVYDWSLNADLPLRENANTADGFIRTFQWANADHSHHGMEPYFNITAIRQSS